MPIHSVRGLWPPLGWEFELLCQPLELGLIADGVVTGEYYQRSQEWVAL